MKPRKPLQSLLGTGKSTHDASGSVRKQLEKLRQKSAAATRREEIDVLLDEARALLKSTFQTEFEEGARKLFRELRNRAEAVPSSSHPESPVVSASRKEQLTRRIQRERIRLNSSGGLDDMELAVEGLYNVLRELRDDETDAALYHDALSALEAAGAHPPLKQKVKDLLESPNVSHLPGAQAAIERLRSLPAATPQLAPLPQPPGAASPDTALTQRLSHARRLFYAGDYYEAVDALTEILQLDPDNSEARERLAQVEDNIRRGIVPDSRVPFEARAAFGRAQSLERAGRFEESRQAYQLSLEEAGQGGALLKSWQPAVEALLRVDNCIIARQIREEADALLQSDKWLEALEKYEAVARLLPDDGQAGERSRLLRLLLERSEAVQAQVQTPMDDLAQVSGRLVELRQALEDLRPKAPASQRLNRLEAEISARAQSLRDRIVERSQQLLTQGRYQPHVAGTRRLTAEAVRLLSQARRLVPGDSQVFDLAQSAEAELARMEQVEQDLNEARRLINLNTAAARAQVRDLLHALQEYDQEPVYLQLVSSLQSQYLEEARQALRRQNLNLASALLAEATQDLFGVLGAAEEAGTLQQQLGAARRKPWLRLAGAGAGIILLVLVLGGLGRWMGMLNFPPFATPTLSPTAPPTTTTVFTATSSPTVTASLTFTAVPSRTATPGEKPTPSATSTSVPRFGAVKIDSTARLTPNGLAAWAFTLRAADPVQILEEATDDRGQLWYKILYIRGESVLIGWARATDINVMPTPVPR